MIVENQSGRFEREAVASCGQLSAAACAFGFE